MHKEARTSSTSQSKTLSQLVLLSVQRVLLEQKVLEGSLVEAEMPSSDSVVETSGRSRILEILLTILRAEVAGKEVEEVREAEEEAGMREKLVRKDLEKVTESLRVTSGKLSHCILYV